MEQNTISAGIQGVSRALYDSYILPVYTLASEIKNFEDNGTAAWGYGFARHDQTLFTFFARKLGLTLHPFYCNPKKLRYGSKKIYFGVLKWFKLRKHHEKDPNIIAHAQEHMLLG